MSTPTKQPYAQVMETAEQVVEILRPNCDRIEIAGSLKRGRPMIGDIELIALPTKATDLFGNVTAGNTQLDYFFMRSNITLIKNGSKYKQFQYAGFTVDLFLPESPAHWGCISLIRTGSSEFNKWLMAEAQWEAGVRFRDGRLTRQGMLLDTPEESDVLEALGLPWIPPNLRDDGDWLDLVTDGLWTELKDAGYVD